MAKKSAPRVPAADLAQVRACVDRYLPDDAKAHRVAVREDPANFPLGVRPPVPIHLAVLTGRKWQTGRVINIAFLDGTSGQRQAVKNVAPRWLEFANLNFNWVDDPAQAEVRVSFRQSGAWSYIGTDALGVPKKSPTMNFGWIDDGTILHEFGHCLAGDTLIDCPRDLAKYPLGIPIKDLVGKTPWVYGWKDGRITVRRASRVWLSKPNARTVRVKLGSDQTGRPGAKYLPPMELVGTPDHPVLLSDGVTWRNLGDLRPGDRLCSMYRSGNGDRSRIRWTGGPGRVREHEFVCAEAYGSRPEGHDCHHRNENKLDQSVENLEWKPEYDHHRDHSTGRQDTPETSARRSAAQAGRVHSPETRAKMSAQRKGRAVSEATRAKMSAAHKARGITPDVREKMLAGRARFIANGGRSGMFGKTDSDETRAKKAEAARLAHARRTAAASSLLTIDPPVNHVVLAIEDGPTQDVYDMTVPGTESFVANGVVVHNCLGCIHEHQSPAAGIPWNRDAVYKYYSGPPNNWDRATIDSNIFERYGSDVTQFTDWDPKSIMEYPLDAKLLTDPSKAVGWNRDLSEADRKFIATIYPKDAPPPPGPPSPPPPPPPGGGITIPAAGSYKVRTDGGKAVVEFG